ncbi:MAG: restriction endonuclease [Planctomycetota bacterium]|jgi:hypothetical protein
MTSDLILPSEIPWNQIKGADLEELLYWLFDSMGAKDLEWRIGGKGSGAADQGRDLELVFFTPSPDGTLTKQHWWVEAKGRTGTVEASEVREAVLNAAGKSHIEVLVVATNTNFSNPTRDWVKEWQQDHLRPIIKLWEKTELENLCSKNPLAVIRLHAKALSPQGKVEVVSSKLWDYASFSDEPTLKSIWECRESVSINERALFALAASEMANGDIGARSWALMVPNDILESSLCNGLLNLLYLAFRANEIGVRQEPIIRAISYFIVVTCQSVGPDNLSSLLSDLWDSVDGQEYPQKVRERILEPVLRTLKLELRDICTSDCSRVVTDPELLQASEIEAYWDRLSLDTDEEKEDKSILTIESLKEPCKIGFTVNERIGCPLCNVDNPHKDISDFIRIVGQVVRFRSRQKSGA